MQPLVASQLLQPHQGASPHLPEFDRLAVVTIQGGGIYGLNLLGQLSYLTEHVKIVPVAVAGNSAGSIVAALYWAGYTPWEIRDIFADMAERKELAALVGPFVPNSSPYTLADFRAMKNSCEDFADSHLASGQPTGLFKRAGRWACTPVRAVGTCWSLRRIRNSVTPHFDTRGCFLGDKFVDEIDRLIRHGPLLRNRPNVPTGQHLEFGDVRKLIADDPSYNPPALFLTATNVTGRKLEVFSSIDDSYDRVSIAKAVRASAGFPVFFRPVEFRDNRYAGWYSDGGIVSNYPAWIFSKEFRLRLLEAPEYRPLASRSWVHFGLRLERAPIQPDILDTSPKLYFSSLARLVLRGEARSELENRLENLVTRSFTIQQPASETGVPDDLDLLDIDKVTPDLVKEMYRVGANAGAKLGEFKYMLPERPAIEDVLKQLVERILLVFGQSDNSTLQFRSNVFIPSRETLYNRYSVNMEPPPADTKPDDPDPTLNRDYDLELRFDSGLTGFCVALRRPLICNLKEIGKQQSQLLDKLFGMSLEQHEKVRRDRTWLASVPIFDPLASFPRDVATPSPGPQPPHNAAFHHALGGRTDGAVLGVLNLDASLSYSDLSPPLDPDPTKPAHNEDSRIVAALHMMTVAATEIGALLDSSLAHHTPSRNEP